MKENKSLDYSKGENWLFKQDNGDKDVDVFFLYPTAVDPKHTEEVPEIDHFLKFKAFSSLEKGPSCFDEYANIFAPYYHQMSFHGISKCEKGQEFVDKIDKLGIKDEAFVALDYYFEHYNNGRPFILASHSQGSATMLHIISEYMKMHPDRYGRMIAAYIPGFSVSNRLLEENPHLKAAEKEDDIGVIITWNIEGPNQTMDNFPVFEEPIICINPLNWKTDDTYAPIEMNKGSYDIESHSVIEGVADAKIDIERKVIIVSNMKERGYEPVPVEMGFFGDDSYHFDDWCFFYNNIKENGLKRIEAYFNK